MFEADLHDYSCIHDVFLSRQVFLVIPRLAFAGSSEDLAMSFLGQ